MAAQQMYAHYVAAKQRQPDATTAIILVPAINELWSNKLSHAGAKLVTTKDRGELLIEQLSHGTWNVHVSAPWPVQVWLDPAVKAPNLSRLGSNRQTMIFDGHLDVVPVQFLVDSGASHSFVPVTLAQHMHWRMQPTPMQHAVMADSAVTCSILGTTKVKLSLGPIIVCMCVLVLDTADMGFDMIVGDDFNITHESRLDWNARTLTVRDPHTHVQHIIPAASGAVPKPSINRSLQPAAVQLSSIVAKTYGSALLCTLRVTPSGTMESSAPDMPVPAKLSDTKPAAFDRVPDAPVTVLGAQEPVVPLELPTDLDPTIKDLVSEFADVFLPVPAGLPPDRGEKHCIPLIPGAKPAYRRMHRFSPMELAEAKQQVGELLEKGWIQPSTSPYSANVLFVPKKDNTVRMVYDYRALNAITLRNRFPLPRIDDLFDQLHAAKYMSSLDLTGAYNQIRIRDEDVPLTAFSTPFGHFEFRVLTFGLTNAPATFQTCMNQIFAKHLNKFVLLYLDDVVVYSNTLSEHLQHLRTVLTTLRQNRFFAKLSKCVFGKPEIEYLGHFIGNGCLRPDPRKLQVVADWPVPKDVPELRSFLGLANYFRRFIQGYSSMVSALNDLLQKGVPFVWDKRQQHAFDAVRLALTSAPVLHLADPDQPYEVIADASVNGCGAVLMQDGHPIAYLSKKFTPAERNYATGEQELFACFTALKEWRCYLEGTDFTLVTDHCPLTTLKSQTMLSRKQARWLEFFSRFHYEWVYRPGRNNVADPLSRNPSLLALTANPGVVPDAQPHLVHELLAGYELDTWFHANKNIRSLSKSCAGFWVKPGKPGMPALIVVPNVGDTRKRIMTEFHATRLAGHVGRERTLELISRQFWWPGITRDVTLYVESCDSCQRTKARSGKSHGLLNSLPVPDAPWQHVTMDFITGLKTTKRGVDAICVFVDRLTKMTHLVPTTKSVTSAETAFLLFNNVVKLHGEPETLVTDRGSVFSGQFLPHYARLLGTQTRLTTAYHPQTDGQTERMNRVLEDMLRAFISPMMDDWDELLPACEFAINNAYNASVRNTPFYLNYGRHPRTPMWHELRNTPSDKVPAAKALAKRIDDALKAAKQCMDAAQQRQKAYYDRNKMDASYAPDELVMLDTRNIRRGAFSKLMPKWIGPFHVEHMVGKAAVKLRLPPSLRIHHTFHVSLVKQYKGVPDAQHAPLLPLLMDTDGSSIWSVDHIVTHRTKQQRTNKRSKKYHTVYEYQVRWTNCSTDDDSWLDTTAFSDNGLSIRTYWQRLGRDPPDGALPI